MKKNMTMFRPTKDNKTNIRLLKITKQHCCLTKERNNIAVEPYIRTKVATFMQKSMKNAVKLCKNKETKLGRMSEQFRFYFSASGGQESCVQAYRIDVKNSEGRFFIGEP